MLMARHDDVYSVKIRLGKVWCVIERLMTIWKSDHSDKIKSKFFKAVVMLVLLYGCITRTVMKHFEKS